jgi:hypothetical protein
MPRQFVGWVAAISGMGLWLSAKHLGIGPMVGMDRTAAFVLIAVLCWGGLALIGSGRRDEAPPDTGTDLSEMGSVGSTEYEARKEAVSPGKLSPGGNRNWLFAFLGVGLIVVFVYIGRMPDPEASAALEQLDSIVAERRQETDEDRFLFDSASSEITTPTSTPATEQEMVVAMVRILSGFLEENSEIDAELAEEYGVSGGPHAMWLENDYYVRPSAYPDVRSHFLSYLDYLIAVREVFSRESSQVRFEQAFAEEGMGGMPDVIEGMMQGLREGYPSADTLFMLRAAYGETALELHDELLRFEGALLWTRRQENSLCRAWLHPTH